MRESRQGIVQVQSGLHDLHFLPFGDVGIGRPESAGKPCQLANMKSGVFVGSGRTGHDSRRPEGRPFLEGITGDVRTIQEGEVT